MGETLSAEEMARWVAFKRATDAVLGGVVADITAATGLSSADFSVLTRVVEEPGDGIRQQRLSDSLGWERSRLSRQLARMERRGLLRRGGTSGVRTIVATGPGREVALAARVAHADAVRRRLTAALDPEDAEALGRGLAALAAADREA